MTNHDRLPYATNLLHKMADLFAERNAVYKDNFRMVGKIMSAMFPGGLELKTPEDHNKFHLFMLAIVKLTRYAINYEGGHKDSLEDMIVYLSMVAALDAEAEAQHPELLRDAELPDATKAR
jgi:hypothetical protein